MTNKYKNRKYEVLPYSKNWPSWFEVEARNIKEIFADCLIGVEHVGSTAVPGMSGKPTIDILVLVNNISCGDKIIPKMKKIGYESKGEYISIGSRLFVKEKDNHVLYNVHIFENKHPEARRMLGIRDYLRKNKKEADRYGQLKLELFKKYPNDYEMYRKNKDQYFNKLMKAAMKNSKM